MLALYKSNFLQDKEIHLYAHHCDYKLYTQLIYVKLLTVK